MGCTRTRSHYKRLLQAEETRSAKMSRENQVWNKEAKMAGVGSVKREVAGDKVRMLVGTGVWGGLVGNSKNIGLHLREMEAMGEQGSHSESRHRRLHQ